MESERRLIAQELHDGVGQVLAAAIMAAESIQGEGGAAVETTTRLSGILREAVRDVRRMSHGLRPTVLDELGADVAIRDAADQLSTEACTIVYETSGPVRRLPEPVETVVYRVAQEAMTNAIRHSGATRVEAQLRFDPGRVQLTVTDNGIGLPPTLREQGLGITGMRERARLVEGTFEISSPSGHGVRVSLSVPTVLSGGG
ncbi:MAG: two-component system, NarL family, sensor histidine kinase UhpB [Chloroflexi bacterium]|jgi:signal transduction histidine kinase|nr:MAG: two-component system, NarL family, sensor histidine kinase UhpB [Chloroflexota bacterium]